MEVMWPETKLPSSGKFLKKGKRTHFVVYSMYKVLIRRVDVWHCELIILFLFERLPRFSCYFIKTVTVFSSENKRRKEKRIKSFYMVYKSTSFLCAFKVLWRLWKDLCLEMLW